MMIEIYFILSDYCREYGEKNSADCVSYGFGDDYYCGSDGICAQKSDVVTNEGEDFCFEDSDCEPDWVKKKKENFCSHFLQYFSVVKKSILSIIIFLFK